MNIQEIFNSVANKYELAEDMLQAFRNMNLDEETYNTIIIDWDNLLNKFYSQKVIDK